MFEHENTSGICMSTVALGRDETRSPVVTMPSVAGELKSIVNMKNHIDDCMSMNIFKKTTKTIHLKSMLTRNTAQLGYSGIIQYDSMYE